MRNLERAEDIAPEAMNAGIKWTWETFPEYLDSVERLPKGINYSAHMGHSALRTYVMGERAFTDTATEDDIDRMQNLVREAIQAGAMGFTTSRTRNHQTPQRQPVASRLATWDGSPYSRLRPKRPAQPDFRNRVQLGSHRLEDRAHATARTIRRAANPPPLSRQDIDRHRRR